MPIKLFYTPNHIEGVRHALIRVEPIELEDMYQERAKKKPNPTLYYGLFRKQK